MTAFLFGVLSSLAASVIALALGLLRGSRPLWWLVTVCSWCTGTALKRVYSRQSSSEQEIARDLSRARWIKVLAGRGNVLTREVFSPLWSGALSVDSVQVLLPAPHPQGDSWLDRRSNDLHRFDPGYSPELLRDQVQANLDYLTHATRCQRSLRCPGGRSWGVQAGGHQNSRPVVSGVPGVRSVQGDHALAGEGLGEAVGVAGGGDQVGVVHEAVGAGSGEGLGHDRVEA